MLTLAQTPYISGVTAEPKKLPLIVARTIRRNEYRPADADALLEIAKLISAHEAADYKVGKLETLLATAVMTADSQDEDSELSPAAREIRSLARTMLTSSRNSPVAKRGADQTPATLLSAVKQQVEKDQREREMRRGDLNQIADAIRIMVQKAAQKHPEMGLSFGYIGNAEIWGDDRSYRVFTKLATLDCIGACNISFGGYSHNRLGDMLVTMEKRFATWLRQTNARLKAGEIRRVGREH